MKKIILFFLLVVVSIGNCGERITTPEALFYYQPAASVFGSEAVWINPAGIGIYNASNIQLMFDYYDNRFAKSWGTASTSEKFGVAYRYIYNPEGQNFQEYTFASGSPVGKKMNFGLSYSYFKNAPELYKKRHFWTIGLMGSFIGKFNWGMVFSNLNKNKVDGEKTETEHRYSLAYRPYGSKYTFAVDMRLSSGTRLSNAEYIYHAEIRPINGLYIDGYYSTDKIYQIGLRANLIHYFTGSKSKFDSKRNGKGTTFYIGHSSVRMPSVIPNPKRRLSLNVSGSIPENPPQPIFGKKTIPFSQTILNIYRAAKDDSIDELFLKLKSVSLGIGQAQELYEALSFFKDSKKKIVCHIEYPNNISYYIGSIADQIFIPPVSQLNLVGLRAELTFYAGTLDKLGVNFDMMRIGDYKTGAETYTRKESTPANKEQINRLLDNIYEQFVEGIAKGRNLSRDSVKMIIDNGPYTSEKALKYGLIDGLMYRDELHKEKLSKIPEISFLTYLSDTLMNDSWVKLPTIAVVVGEGEIKGDNQTVMSFENSTGITPELMKNAFNRASFDHATEAIVFRLNSPGGSALASEEIYHSATQAGKKVPIVISMANVAASGGYHLSMSSPKLFANKATITGSIGIYGGKVDLSELNKKIDLGKELYTRGQYAGMLSTVKPFNDDERKKYFSQMQAFYEHFIEMVAGNRSLSKDSVDNLGQGRVWTGEEAKANGLIDEFGGIKQALDYAAAQINADDYRVELYPQKRPLFHLPGKSFFNMISSIFSKAESMKSLEDLIVVDNDYLLERMPFDLMIQ